ncbi:phenylpyruvate decarboxylase [Azospirillum brasilense]|uniref:Phenylpyruvate decarboxylase n=1 Tax=Azospirillum brasilense TaxID=192 RepID=A0A560B3R9_AZOBR|nr:indolepyruvate/phenylpyruvate decarboxylase [Azospirillum brasilense]TWA67271.1 phenylpyruvate decarboxylase [Azospirillum brasilense]
MKLAEALLRALKDRGAQAMFGIPGDFALPFFKVAEETQILPLHTLSHEPAVGFAADAAARYSSTLGVAAVTYGAGAFNMVNAVAGAYAEKSPVVVISGAPGTTEGNAGLLLHHQGRTLDTQFQVFKEITVAQARLDDPAKAPAEIARVLGAARALSRPVYLEIPRNMVNAEVEPVGDDPAWPVDRDALAACADEVLAAMRSATSPVLMVCVEVRRYGLEAKVAELAQRLGVPVVTTFMGRGLLADAPTPPLGTYIGVAGDAEITRLVEESDGLFLLGAILSDTNFAVSQRKIDLRKTIHAFDRAVTLGYHSYADIPLDGLVDALLERLPPSDRTTRGKEPHAYPTGLQADGEPITPMDIARAVNDRVRAGQEPLLIAADMGDCLFTAMDMIDAGLMAPGYYAGMGFGVPAGIGAQCVSGGKRILTVVGDGAFQMTGWELGNCRRLGIDPIVILFNNASWEMLRTFQPESAFNNLDDWRFADMAAGMGGDGVRVRTRAELKAALDKAFATRGRFQLIEAMIPRGVLSDTLARFVQGQKRLHAPPRE